ncbi:MAG: hypothetical protein ACRCUY_08280 [Thermoguttaceae bacterium]
MFRLVPLNRSFAAGIVTFFVTLMLFSLFSESAFAQRGRRRVVTPQARTETTKAESDERTTGAEPMPADTSSMPAKTSGTRTATTAKTPAQTVPALNVRQLSSEEAEKELIELCRQVKDDIQKPTESDLIEAKKRLITATNALIRVFERDPNRKAAKFWRETFKLAELQGTLNATDGPEKAILDEVWGALHTDHAGIKWQVFDGLRDTLRTYRTLAKVLDDQDYEKQMVGICDALPKYINEYLNNTDPQYGIFIRDAFDWLEDMSVIDPRTTRIVYLARCRFDRVNLQLFVTSKFTSVGFQTNVDEKIEINDNILGTRVVGSGTIIGNSGAEFVPRTGVAEIKVVVDTKMNSRTTGYHFPVTLNTDTSGTMKATKSIIIAPDKITTTPTKTVANLQSNISNIRISGGSIVQNVARDRIQEQRGASQAEARRRAEQRMNERIDSRINPRINELNENYQTKLREPLVKAGFFPRIWDLNSTAEKIDWSVLIGEPTQPAAGSKPPQINQNVDVLVQVHQSSLNNAAATALSGRSFDEEAVRADLEKQFKELPPALQPKEGQKPINVTFAQSGPIAISFVDNKIKAVFRIDSFLQEGTKYPGLNITIFYDVKTNIEKVENGNDKVTVIFEQAEAPQVFPPDFDPNSGKSISARHQAIRTIVTKRLEVGLPKHFEGKPQELKGDWEGKGKLVPVLASCQDGWLSLAWNWVPESDETK